MTVPRILIVDDEPGVCRICALYLHEEDFATRAVHRGDAVMEAIADFEPDLIVLDLMLPGLDGWHVADAVRKESETPIIMLTARDADEDRIRGLNSGADDYLVKPFNARELVARVKAVLRRTGTGGSGDASNDMLRHGSLALHVDAHQAFVDGRKLNLTPKEFQLLYFLMRRPTKTFTRTELLDYIWGYDFLGDERTVDVHVKRLREKLGRGTKKKSEHIVTVWGVGYRMGEA